MWGDYCWGTFLAVLFLSRGMVPKPAAAAAAAELSGAQGRLDSLMRLAGHRARGRGRHLQAWNQARMQTPLPLTPPSVSHAALSLPSRSGSANVGSFNEGSANFGNCIK